MPMEDTYGIQSRIGSIIVVERWYCCRGSPVFSDRNIQLGVLTGFINIQIIIYLSIQDILILQQLNQIVINLLRLLDMMLNIIKCPETT